MKRHFDLAPIRSRFGPPFSESSPGGTPEDFECALDDDFGHGNVTVPDRIQKLIAQRSIANSARQQKNIPAAGQIVRIPPSSHPMLAEEPNEYLAVLLDAPVSGEKWSCFPVTRDLVYATYWDLALGPEEDDRDPMCQIAQIWNKTTVDTTIADKVLGELSAARMSAVKSLAKDFAFHTPPCTTQDTRPGVLLARELSDGIGVVTGTPIGSNVDPRIEYQEIYRRAAQWIARQCEAERRLTAIKATKESTTSIRLQFVDWVRRLSVPTYGWKLASTVAVILTGALLVLNMESAKETAIPPSASSGQPPFKYISSGQIQELKARNPEILVKEIADRLAVIGGAPETRKSGDQMFSLFVSTKALPSDKLALLLADYNLSLPEDGALRIDIIREAER